MPIAAITLDLDDTLWPFAPIATHIDQVLDDWLRTHSPATAERFPIPAMQALRVATWKPTRSWPTTCPSCAG